MWAALFFFICRKEENAFKTGNHTVNVYFFSVKWFNDLFWWSCISIRQLTINWRKQGCKLECQSKLFPNNFFWLFPGLSSSSSRATFSETHEEVGIFQNDFSVNCRFSTHQIKSNCVSFDLRMSYFMTFLMRLATNVTIFNCSTRAEHSAVRPASLVN